MKKDKKKVRNTEGRVNATQPGYHHKHGAGFITIWKEPVIVDGTEKKLKIVYKRRPNHDQYVGTNNERVVQARKKRDPNYTPVRANLVVAFERAKGELPVEVDQALQVYG